ncbi:MAG: 1-deoxy-D-xylulose-5-phosphate synthase [Clostridia bacterium]|nr:1-deoxy-D-xylulose-5-phosphate synthase [Clostridia bacterium]
MEYKLLSEINSPKDIKKLDYTKLNELSGEIRYKLIETVSENGGHLASNLGMVELTVALHKVFDSPKDQFVYDVGHQCYTHKLLTGRYESFSTLRTKGGISGFTRPTESEHDIFFSGHSATSVSAGLGLAQAKALKGDRSHVVSVIGDGSFTGGMVFEALNNGGRSKANHIVVLNDNKMSISENVGAFAKYLAVIRSRPQYYSFKANTEKVLNKVPFGEKIVKELYKVKTDIKNKVYEKSTFFEDLGYRYMGPIDGHNIENLCDALQSAKSVNGPVLLHVITVKGKGYEYAEKDPSVFHGISKFDVDTGEAISSSKSYSDKFGETLCDLAKNDDSLCAITAAMGLGTGLGKFSGLYPERFFDVGIAEEHAVTFASGLSKNGMKPVFAVYSTFLQRCYDQLIHDVALQKQKVLLAVDRAGFVGEDGETHHGLFDVAFLGTVPGMKVYSPCNFNLLEADLKNALYSEETAVAVRYPRGTENENTKELKSVSFDYSVYGDEKSKTAIVTYGRITAEAIEAVKEIKDAFLVSLNLIKPIPEGVIDLLLGRKRVFFFEEGQKSAGVAEKLGITLLEKGYKGKYSITAVEDKFVEQASVNELLSKYGLNKEAMIKKLSEEF